MSDSPLPAHKTTVSFATLGCKTNQFESATMQQTLVDAGYQVVAFDSGAELVIVNTCTVTNATDAQSRNLIRRARKYNADCRVIVTGCYAQIDPQALSGLPGVSMVIGNEEKQQLLDYLGAQGELEAGQEPQATASDIRVSDIRKAETVCLTPLTSFAGRSRAFVQIQNGCDAFCSYCIIPYARGASRSAQPDEIIKQIQGLVDNGYPEVVLTGIHIGGYGADLPTTTTLLELIQRIEAQTSLQRLRLGSIEPTEISQQLIDAVAASSIICPHFHIPLQAGDDEVLTRMGRNYDTVFFAELIQRIRQACPDAAIVLDVITGFPGEDDAAFENTYGLIESLPITDLHVFPYSKRPGTPAATMPAQ
ncbi:MAG: tRNA (N(6)-L-threonylcarbamoyladenosine(37)-C(2))-methylthiotransferase MtaB, partial [Desulfuromonadales bacterium]|nr:tRNA (N(6)-L-threonylcarbamoyladenosine(37)-C(2))-methylthiotransferase MtaB [Desulfuromonadales bacterium]